MDQKKNPNKPLLSVICVWEKLIFEGELKKTIYCSHI